jgi:SET domain
MMMPRRPAGAFWLPLLGLTLFFLVLLSSNNRTIFILAGMSTTSTTTSTTTAGEQSNNHHNDDDTNNNHEVAAAARTAAAKGGAPPPPPLPPTCSIYMAPASAHGNPGYGIYTTRAVRRGESFLRGSDVPSIPILEYSSSDDDDDDDDEQYSGPTKNAAALAKALRGRARQHFVETFSNYWWTHGKPDHVSYLSGQSADFQLTFGALPNHHCLLNSLEAHYPTTSYADRRAVQSPAAGAYSYHNGRVFVAGRPVAAGEEIYLNYGMCVVSCPRSVVVAALASCMSLCFGPQLDSHPPLF